MDRLTKFSNGTIKKVATLVPIIGAVIAGTVAVSELRAKQYADEEMKHHETTVSDVLTNKVEVVGQEMARQTEAIEWIKDSIKQGRPAPERD